MAHFAKVENGVVTQVIVVGNCDIGGCIGEENVPAEWWDPAQHVNCGTLDFPETEPNGKAFIKSIGLDGDWWQTSYNGNFRDSYAGIGYSWDGDKFAAPAAPEETPAP